MLIKNNQKLIVLNKIQTDAIQAFNSDPQIKFDEVECCKLCGSNDFFMVANSDQFGIHLDTRCCNACGLVFSKNQLTSNATKIFYDKYYRKIYEGVHGASLEHDFYRKLFSGWVSRVPAFVKSDYFVVEIGCGGGWNLLPFHQKNIRHQGFDYDSDMIAYGKVKYGLNLYEGGLEEAITVLDKVDYLILSQVVEHLKNPLLFLRTLRDVFSDKGLLCITVPSID